MKKRRKKRFKRLEGYKTLAAKPINHRHTRRSFLHMWRKMAERLYSPQVLGPLPPFAQVLAKTFWDADDDQIIDAMMDGDPAFFVAFQLRLDQIDVALVEANAGIAARSPVIRCKYILDGFRQAASDNLVRQGGKWPMADATLDPPEEES